MLQNLPRTKSHGRGVGGTRSASSSTSPSSALPERVLSPTQSVDTHKVDTVKDVQSNERAARGIGATRDVSVAGAALSPVETVVHTPTSRPPRPGGRGSVGVPQAEKLDLAGPELKLE